MFSEAPSARWAVRRGAGWEPSPETQHIGRHMLLEVLCCPHAAIMLAPAVRATDGEACCVRAGRTRRCHGFSGVLSAAFSSAGGHRLGSVPSKVGTGARPTRSAHTQQGAVCSLLMLDERREATPALNFRVRKPDPAGMTAATVRLALGVGGTIVVIALGLVASLSSVHDLQLTLDRQVAADRVSSLTSLAEALTVSATPEVTGVAALLLVPLILFALRRRVDALRALCVMGGSVALAFVAKFLIGEPRPPQSLWAVPADSGASYPSGHTTVVAGIIVALFLVSRTAAARTLVAVAGGAYVVAVAASRVYVSNHYPLDVVGSLLAAVAAGFVVAGLSLVPVVARWTARWGASSQRASAVSTD